MIKKSVKRLFGTTHRVTCCSPNIEIFEELWGAPILASYLLPDLCCYSPVNGRVTSERKDEASERIQSIVNNKPQARESLLTAETHRKS